MMFCCLIRIVMVFWWCRIAMISILLFILVWLRCLVMLLMRIVMVFVLIFCR